MVTQDPDEALAICDRVAVLRSGEIQQYATPFDMVSKPSHHFVGQFVFQKNILPIKYIDNSYSTCIGKLNLPTNTSMSSESVCMFDKNSIRIQPSSNGLFTVISKEYRINNYVYTVRCHNLKMRSEMSLDTNLSIGDKCKVEFIHEEKFLILPEMIRSSF